MDEVQLLELRVAFLEGELDRARADIVNLYDAMEKMLNIVNSNIASIGIIAGMVEQQHTTKIDWPN